MKNSSFENRVSLTRKNENLIRTVEELSSCYAKREEFALKNSYAFPMHTSEICLPVGFCAFVIAAGAYVYAVAAAAAAVVELVWFVLAAWTIASGESNNIAIADFTTYKNIA